MRAKPWLALLPWLALVSAEPDEGGILPLPSGGTPSLHPEIPGFHSFRPEVQLPDYECQFLPEDWYELKQNFVGSLNFFREFGAVRFQSETDEEQLGDLQIWLNYAVAFSDHNWSVRDCPFANFIRRLYLWSLCTIVAPRRRIWVPKAGIGMGCHTVITSSGRPPESLCAKSSVGQLSGELGAFGDEHGGSPNATRNVK
ncbi:unnamed protein product [Durusdinium trenchii]|uniref:Uncharacterized protein n=1 Tax=Durusdinium trenchii TaxID=1381693 RepID=A0ABP0LTI3_9DINO